MKMIIGTALCLAVAVAGSAYAKGDKACEFKDAAKIQEHLQTHVTYPAKGKDIKEACKKEMPNEFAKSEKACITKRLKNNTEYKSAEEVMKALGVDASGMKATSPVMPDSHQHDTTPAPTR